MPPESDAQPRATGSTEAWYVTVRRKLYGHWSAEQLSLSARKSAKARRLTERGDVMVGQGKIPTIPRAGVAVVARLGDAALTGWTVDLAALSSIMSGPASTSMCRLTTRP
jgi:hypothetical protein